MAVPSLFAKLFDADHRSQTSIHVNSNNNTDDNKTPRSSTPTATTTTDDATKHQTITTQADITKDRVDRLTGTWRDVKWYEKAGWAYKEGAKVKNWKRRFFVLHHTMLYYYADVKDSTPKGIISLQGCELHDSKKKPFAFDIVPPVTSATPANQDADSSINPFTFLTKHMTAAVSLAIPSLNDENPDDRVYTIQCDSEADKKEWMLSIQSNLDHDHEMERRIQDEMDRWKQQLQQLQDQLETIRVERELAMLSTADVVDRKKAADMTTLLKMNQQLEETNIRLMRDIKRWREKGLLQEENGVDEGVTQAIIQQGKELRQTYAHELPPEPVHEPIPTTTTTPSTTTTTTTSTPTTTTTESTPAPQPTSARRTSRGVRVAPIESGEPDTPSSARSDMSSSTELSSPTTTTATPDLSSLKTDNDITTIHTHQLVALVEQVRELTNSVGKLKEEKKILKAEVKRLLSVQQQQPQVTTPSSTAPSSTPPSASPSSNTTTLTAPPSTTTGSESPAPTHTRSLLHPFKSRS